MTTRCDNQIKTHKFQHLMWPGHGLDYDGNLKRHSWNYLLSDCSVIYTHADGQVYMYDAGLMKHQQVSRSIAAMLIFGSRHGECMIHSTSGVLRYR